MSDRPLSGPIRTLGVAALGCGGVVAKMYGHAENGRIGAFAVGVLAVAIAALLGAPGLPGRQRLAGAAVLAMVWELIFGHRIGRAPIPLAVAGVFVAHRAAGRPPRGSRAAEAPPLRLVAIGVLAAAEWSWLHGARMEAFVGGLLAAAATLVASERIGAVAWAERRACGLVGAGVGSIRRRAAGPTRRLGELLRRGGREAGVAAHRLWDVLVRAWEAAIRGVRRAGREGARALERGVRHAVAPDNRAALVVGLITAIVVAKAYPRLVSTNPQVLFRGTSDIPGTIDRAEWIRFWPPRLSVPHPGWSLLLLAFMPVFGRVGAVVVILGAATGAAAAFLVGWGRSRWDDARPLRPAFAAALGLGWVFAESPAMFVPLSTSWWGRFTLSGQLARGASFAPLHLWPTPTITLSMGFAFGMIAYALLAIRRAETGSASMRSTNLRLATITVVTTLIQPATVLAYVPALLVYLVVSRRWTRATVRTALWFAVPAGLIVGAQVIFLATHVSPWEQATWLWRPFWSWSYFGMDRPVFWAIYVLPLLAAALGGRRFLADPWVALSLIATAIAIWPFLLLEQTTVAHVPDGDLGVPLFMCIGMLWVGALRFVLQELQARWDDRTERGVAVGPIMGATLAWLALSLCAGVLELAAVAGLTPAL